MIGGFRFRFGCTRALVARRCGGFILTTLMIIGRGIVRWLHVPGGGIGDLETGMGIIVCSGLVEIIDEERERKREQDSVFFGFFWVAISSSSSSSSSVLFCYC